MGSGSRDTERDEFKDLQQMQDEVNQSFRSPDGELDSIDNAQASKDTVPILPNETGVIHEVEEENTPDNYSEGF